MKKLMSILLCGVLLFSLAACDSTPNAADSTPTPKPTPTPGQTVSTEPSKPADNVDADSTEDQGSKVLVAYFSATNNTKAVAQTIAGHLDGDLFEITPSQPYTTEDLNWRDENSWVCKEHDDPVLQTVELDTVTPNDWANYDTVFIGYPIWWQNASWVVTSFVAANDFDGKTVIPFCTSSSSGLGESDKNLAAHTEGGNWLEGVRFRSSVSADDVTEWLDGLGL